MKAIPLLALLLLVICLFGCIENRGQDASASGNVTNPANASVSANTTNITTNATNTAPPASEWKRFNATAFSFEYPANMKIQTQPGIFTGIHELQGQPGQTGEVMVVLYFNTSAVYGPNRDKEFRDEPSRATSDFLNTDKANDSAGILSNAYSIGEMHTFAILENAFAAEVPFKTKFNANKTYEGYALDLYIPERSTHAKVRIFALDQERADAMERNFLLSLRPE